MGEMDGWQEWKYRTEFTFNGSGYEWVLTDATYSGQNTQMNRVVYYKLLVATVGLTAAYNMVKFWSWKELMVLLMVHTHQ